MEQLLNFAQPFNVQLFEHVVRTFLDASNPEHHQAHNVLRALRESPQSWQYVAKILEDSKDVQSKFIALQILEETIKFRWKALPHEQRLGIRNYVMEKLIALSTDGETMEREKLFVNRLNLVLVQILKQEWPHNWESFIPDLVGAARQSESLCENNMIILQLLSEEVFDFSKEDMTAAKTKVMKATMNEQFKMVYGLCELILERGSKVRLLTTTLRTLLRFLSWIPVGFIFETPLIDRLLNKFFPDARFRNDALACLTEIGSMEEDTAPYAVQLVTLYTTLVGKLQSGMLPLEMNIADKYEVVKEDDKLFVQRLSLFFTGFFGAHLSLLERPEYQPSLLLGLDYLIKISDVEDPEIFKICLDAWTKIATDLYHTECASSMVLSRMGRFAVTAGNGNGNSVIPGGVAAAGNGNNDDDDDNDPEDAVLFTNGRSVPAFGLQPSMEPISPRHNLYARTLSALRYLMISKMARPEEVIVKQEDSGEVVRESTKDTDAIALYKQMRDTLVYLTHLNVSDTESIMLDKLSRQCEEVKEECSAKAINTLSWAIGSISGTMDEITEKQFLVAVIKDLLVLCEQKSGKDNKALIASDIMYVVGQYPRFLRNHWRFLRTVVQKLFEFMHELHPGVQDMACDTFLKLTLKCKRKFVQHQQGEAGPFIDQLLQNLSSVTSDLQTHQVYSFYESVGVILACSPDPDLRAAYLKRLMETPNRQWEALMGEARLNVQTIFQEPCIKELTKILRMNVHVARATQHTYLSQLCQIHLDMLNLYKSYARYISDSVKVHGPEATKHREIRNMRELKVQILILLRTYIERSNDPQFVATQIVETLYEPILGDYASAAPVARDAEVLELFAAIVGKLKNAMDVGVLRVLRATFTPTLEMIALNFEDFPDTRVQFYNLLKQVNANCFGALWSSQPESQKQIVDAIMWGMKHTDITVSELSLEILLQLLANISNVTINPQVTQHFYRDYLLSITSDTLYCLTDRLHKSGFKLHATLLQTVFRLVRNGAVRVPLFEGSADASQNVAKLVDYVTNMISQAFPNVSKQVVVEFVQGLFTGCEADLQEYKQHVRDFLIQLKEFSAEDNRDLFREETALAAQHARQHELQQRMNVPGLVGPQDDPEL